MLTHGDLEPLLEAATLTDFSHISPPPQEAVDEEALNQFDKEKNAEKPAAEQQRSASGMVRNTLEFFYQGVVSSQTKPPTRGGDLPDHDIHQHLLRVIPSAECRDIPQPLLLNRGDADDEYTLNVGGTHGCMVAHRVAAFEDAFRRVARQARLDEHKKPNTSGGDADKGTVKPPPFNIGGTQGFTVGRRVARRAWLEEHRNKFFEGTLTDEDVSDENALGEEKNEKNSVDWPDPVVEACRDNPESLFARYVFKCRARAATLTSMHWKCGKWLERFQTQSPRSDAMWEMTYRVACTMISLILAQYIARTSAAIVFKIGTITAALMSLCYCVTFICTSLPVILSPIELSQTDEYTLWVNRLFHRDYGFGVGKALEKPCHGDLPYTPLNRLTGQPMEAKGHDPLVQRHSHFVMPTLWKSRWARWMVHNFVNLILASVVVVAAAGMIWENLYGYYYIATVLATLTSAKCFGPLLMHSAAEMVKRRWGISWLPYTIRLIVIDVVGHYQWTGPEIAQVKKVEVCFEELSRRNASSHIPLLARAEAMYKSRSVSSIKRALAWVTAKFVSLSYWRSMAIRHAEAIICGTLLASFMTKYYVDADQLREGYQDVTDQLEAELHRTILSEAFESNHLSFSMSLYNSVNHDPHVLFNSPHTNHLNGPFSRGAWNIARWRRSTRLTKSLGILYGQFARKVPLPMEERKIEKEPPEVQQQSVWNKWTRQIWGLDETPASYVTEPEPEVTAPGITNEITPDITMSYAKLRRSLDMSDEETREKFANLTSRSRGLRNRPAGEKNFSQMEMYPLASDTVETQEASSLTETDDDGETRKGTSFFLPGTQRQIRFFHKDTGAQAHMSGTRLPVECVTANKPNQFVHGVGQKRTQVSQRGDLEVSSIAESGREFRFVLKDIIHIEGCPKDLLSWGLLSEDGWTATLNAGGVRGRHYATDPNGDHHVILYDRRHFFLALGVRFTFPEDTEKYTPQATTFGNHEKNTLQHGTAVYTNTVTTNLLHQRYGYCSHAKLDNMLRNSQVGGYGKVRMCKNASRTCDCDTCRMTKIHKRSFYGNTGLTRRNFHAPKPGEQMTAVIDISGPYLPSLRGERFALTLVIHQTRMVYTVTMKTKTQSGAALQTILKAIDEDPSYRQYKPHGAKHVLSAINSDMESSFHFHAGMEFRQMSDNEVAERTQLVTDYRRVCSDHGIQCVVTSSGCSQLNGLVESRHRNLREPSRE